MASTDCQRWAHVRSHLAWKRPGLPTEWTQVLDRKPDAMNPDPLPGYMWLELAGKALHVPAHHLEFQDPADCT